MNGTIYFLQCQNKLKVGFTSGSFEQYLNWLQRRVPFYLQVLHTRMGTDEEEKAFHREHKMFLSDWGGNEWYQFSPELWREAVEFLTLHQNNTVDTLPEAGIEFCET